VVHRRSLRRENSKYMCAAVGKQHMYATWKRDRKGKNMLVSGLSTTEISAVRSEDVLDT
jgi:hypothetical protein